jgi:hypothetical protein
MTTFDQFAEDFWEVELPPLPIRPKTRSEAKRDFVYYAELSILDFQENIPRKFENGTDNECIGRAIYQYLKTKRLNRTEQFSPPKSLENTSDGKMLEQAEQKEINSNKNKLDTKRIIQQIMEDARNRARQDTSMLQTQSTRHTEGFTLNPKSIGIPEIVRVTKTPKDRKSRKQETIPNLPLIPDPVKDTPAEVSNDESSVNLLPLETVHENSTIPTKKKQKEPVELEKPVIDFLRSFNRLKAKEMAQKARDLINNLAKKSKKKKQTPAHEIEMKKFELIQKCLKDFSRSMT